MLRFPEELMLLILDDENGKFAHVPSATCATRWRVEFSWTLPWRTASTRT